MKPRKGWIVTDVLHRLHAPEGAQRKVAFEWPAKTPLLSFACSCREPVVFLADALWDVRGAKRLDKLIVLREHSCQSRMGGRASTRTKRAGANSGELFPSDREDSA